MTNVSKQKLDSKEMNDLLNQMYLSFAKLTKNNTSSFFDEFLGEEERIMFAKRLGAIMLCISDKSPYRIWTTLKISPTTAQKIFTNYTLGKYSSIEKVLKRNRLEYERFFKILEVILNAGMSPRGRGRWDRTTRLLTQK